MQPLTTSEVNRAMPLEKLVKISRGKVYVPVTTDLLPKIELSSLKRTLQFDVNHHFAARVSFSVEANPKKGHLQMSISSDCSDWPEPTELFRTMYSVSLTIAAKLAAERGQPHRRPHEYMLARGSHMLAGYDIPLPASGAELLSIIRSKLEAIHNELPGANEMFMRGPVPGTSHELGEDDD